MTTIPSADHRSRPRSLSVLFVVLAMALAFSLPNIRSAFSQAAVAIVKVNVDVVAKGWRASKLIGSTVRNDKNDRIGTIDDIIIDKDKKQPMYAVLQVGGFLSLGGHLVAIQFDQLKISDDGKVELPGASKDALEGLSEFHYKT
jgi:sporulation protein YlmC with PRC-barrel domain